MGHMPTHQALGLCSLGKFLPVIPRELEGTDDGAVAKVRPSLRRPRVCQATMLSHQASRGGRQAWLQGSHLHAPRPWGEGPPARGALTPSTLI